MSIEIVGAEIGTEWTDSPRDLTKDEAAQVVSAGRVRGVKLHRQLTHSMLAAAVRSVDQILAASVTAAL